MEVEAAGTAEQAGAVIERWVRSWNGSNGSKGSEGLNAAAQAAVIGKVADKVSREWHGKDRAGVDLRSWLADNPKRRQQAQALLALYEKKQRRAAHNSGATHATTL